MGYQFFKLKSESFVLPAAMVMGLVALSSTAARAAGVVAWGDNSNGELGNGSNIAKSTVPVSANGLDSGVTAVAGGYAHSLAIQNGALWAWGDNQNTGQLGNGTLIDSNVPVAVSGLDSDVIAVSAGRKHSLALQSNGAVWTWGDNDRYQLGNGSTLTWEPGHYITTPGPVVGLGAGSGVTAISAGDNHNLAIKNGAVVAWGYNNYGQLGDGTNGLNTNKNTPVAVSVLTSGVTAIAGGYLHSLAIQDGAAYAWGYNRWGQLGDGTSGLAADKNTPVAVSGLTSGVTAIAGGGLHSLAIKDGDVYAWGYNNQGQIGDGTQIERHTPVKVLDLAIDLVDVAAGGDSSYALSSDGSLWVWGMGSFGQLGLGDSDGKLVPTQLLPPTGYKFTGISVESYSDHAVAMMVAVPEPASAGLLVAAGGVFLLGRRRRA